MDSCGKGSWGLVFSYSSTLLIAGIILTAWLRHDAAQKRTYEGLKAEKGILIASEATEDGVYLSRGEGRAFSYLGVPKPKIMVGVGEEHSGAEWAEMFESLKMVDQKKKNGEALAREGNLLVSISSDGVALCDPENPERPLYFIEPKSPLTNRVVAGSNAVSQAKTVHTQPASLVHSCCVQK